MNTFPGSYPLFGEGEDLEPDDGAPLPYFKPPPPIPALFVDGELTCSDSLKAMFEAGFDFYLTASTTSELTGPEFIHLRLDTETLRGLHKLMADCKSVGFNEACVSQSPPSWDEAGELVISQWRLHFNTSEFWFEGLSNNGNQVQSDQLWLDGFAHEIDTKDPKNTVLGAKVLMSFYGGSLFYADTSSMERLQEVVLEQRPEIEAQATAMRMSAAIDAASSSSAEEPTSRPMSPRRAGL